MGEKITKNSELLEQIKEKKKFIFFAIVIFLIMYLWYLLSPKKRLIKTLGNIENISKFVSINSTLNSEKDRELKLCDFYICSAYRPYLIKNQYLDYLDLEMVKRYLKFGVRCMYIEVYNSNLTENADPIIAVGFKSGQWKLSLNTILFDDFCKLIAISAFSSGFVNNPNDPFLLLINLNTQGNLNTLNKMKKIIYRRFKKYLLNNSFTYSQKNIGEIKVKNLMRKIIIITSGGYENSDLEELINHSWDKDHIKKISYKSLDPSINDTNVIKLDSNELQKINKHNLTIVVPEEFSLFSYNYEPEYFWKSGCQCVCVNYQIVDTFLNSYITKFRNDSFVKKDPRLITKEVVNKNNIKLKKSRGKPAPSPYTDDIPNCPLKPCYFD